MEYRFGKTKKKKKKRKKKKKTQTTEEAAGNGTILLPGVLNQNRVDEPVDRHENRDSGCESESGEGSTCDINESAFVSITNDESIDSNNDEVEFLSVGCKWDRWEGIGKDDEIPGPIETNHYNGLHGLRAGAGK